MISLKQAGGDHYRHVAAEETDSEILKDTVT
jgi:hypothetical protein